MVNFEGEEKCKDCKYRARWYNTFFKPIWFKNMYAEAWVCMFKDYATPPEKHRYLLCCCQNEHNMCTENKEYKKIVYNKWDD